jgi:hypothetical protein
LFASPVAAPAASASGQRSGHAYCVSRVVLVVVVVDIGGGGGGVIVVVSLLVMVRVVGAGVSPQPTSTTVPAIKVRPKARPKRGV